jgi:hypothetical protein
MASMPDEPTYRCNAADVAHQTLDDEIVVLNLRTGVYGTILGSGVTIWSALVHGVSVPELVNELADHHGIDVEEIAPEVEAFMAEVVAHELVETVPTIPGRPVLVTDGAEFVEPRLEMFDDMQDLILLDPVHDVDSRGWPHPGD